MTTLPRSVFTIFFLLFCTLAHSLSLADVVVDSPAELISAVNNANSGGDKTILVADGDYDMRGLALYITVDGVTIRGQSGDRSAVVLDSQYVESGTSGVVRIVSSNVTIADITLKRQYYHSIHISASTKNISNIHINNVHIIDPGEQAIKINADSLFNANYRVDGGSVKNCRIELTDVGRNNLTSTFLPCYTGGVDAHWAPNWVISDNVIKGFWCSDGLSEHGIHMWNHSDNNLVERNLIINCDRGIGFGLGNDGRGNNGGIIRNNMIYHDVQTGYSDVGISLEATPNAQVYNNTVYHVHEYAAIEYRFPDTTNAYIANNLLNRDIRMRNGASATVENNLTNAQASWFVGVSTGDLHLASIVSSVVDKGLAIPGLVDDFDGESRPYGNGYDIGADEYGSGQGIAPILLLLVSDSDAIPTVTSAGGRVWMDRNLGAARMAQSVDDHYAYGFLYQWGRLADGHEHRASDTTTALSSGNVPGHDDFILAGSSPWDWRSPQNNGLWQPGTGINNPCPVGFRVPTLAEWETERASWSSDNAAGAFASPLKLVVAGWRDRFNGTVNAAGSAGSYWSSTVSSIFARSLGFDSSATSLYTDSRTFGLSVRCIKD